MLQRDAEAEREKWKQEQSNSQKELEMKGFLPLAYSLPLSPVTSSDILISRLQQQLQQFQEQHDSTLATLHQTRSQLLASEKKNHELELQLLQQRPPLPLPPPPSVPSPATSPRVEEQIEIQRLEGRVKYYQEELAEQRAQYQQLNEKVIRFNSELIDCKNRLGLKEKDFDEERNQKLEQQKLIEELERKVRDFEEEQLQRQDLQQSKSVQARSHRFPQKAAAVEGDGECATQRRGYFDETESSIAPEDDHAGHPQLQAYPRHGHSESQVHRPQQFSTQAITPQERSVAEIIASMLMEELEKFNIRAPGRSALEEISVKVALRLLWSARDLDGQGQRLSLQELLSDQRLLSDLIADTQVIFPSLLLSMPFMTL